FKGRLAMHLRVYLHKATYTGEDEIPKDGLLDTGLSLANFETSSKAPLLVKDSAREGRSSACSPRTSPFLPSSSSSFSFFWSLYPEKNFVVKRVISLSPSALSLLPHSLDTF